MALLIGEKLAGLPGSLNNISDCDLENIEIELLLEGIYRKYGFDFRNYALPFVRRRILHRIQIEQLSSISGLQEKVLHDARVMERLFHDLTINVTEMFRDPGFFQAFRAKVIPRLQELPYIKIWHAGCATGEEVYSMAILLFEAGLYEKVRIYATDISKSSLRQARQGILPLDRMQDYTRNYQRAGGSRAFSEYYTAKGNHVKFKSFLINNIIFGQHNLATDYSLNEFQVIICRNVIIYFNKILQDRVHQLFYESLSMNGVLGLGNKEVVNFTSKASCYSKIDVAEKLYSKIK